jgi:hypothetical protein
MYVSGAVKRRSKAARVSPTAPDGPPAGRPFASFDAQVGTRVHTLLAHYSVREVRPSVPTLLTDVKALLKAHPLQSEFVIPPSRVITAAAVGLRHLPPLGVRCVGTEVVFSGARADSVWELDDGGVGFETDGGLLIIEYTATSDPRRLRSEHRVRQAKLELLAGIASRRPFIGVSVLNLSYPPSSLLYIPTLGPEFPVPLIDTEYFFGPRPVRYQRLVGAVT